MARAITGEKIARKPERPLKKGFPVKKRGSREQVGDESRSDHAKGLKFSEKWGELDPKKRLEPHFQPQNAASKKPQW
jgi:hypothetical protein